MALRRRGPPPDREGTFPERPPEGACGATTWSFALCPPARPVVRRRGGKYNALLPATASFCSRAPAGVCPAVMEEEEDGAAEEQRRFSYQQVRESRVPAGLGEDRVELPERESSRKPPPRAPGGAFPGAESALRPPAPAPAGLPRGLLGGGLQGNAGWSRAAGSHLRAGTAGSAFSRRGCGEDRVCAPKGDPGEALRAGPGSSPPGRARSDLQTRGRRASPMAGRLLPAWVPAPAPQPERRAALPRPGRPGLQKPSDRNLLLGRLRAAPGTSARRGGPRPNRNALRR